MLTEFSLGPFLQQSASAKKKKSHKPDWAWTLPGQGGQQRVCSLPSSSSPLRVLPQLLSSLPQQEEEEFLFSLPLLLQELPTSKNLSKSIKNQSKNVPKFDCCSSQVEENSDCC